MTKFRFQLHPVAEIYGGPTFFELADAPAILEHFDNTFKPLRANSAGSLHSRSRRHCHSYPRTEQVSRSWL